MATRTQNSRYVVTKTGEKGREVDSYHATEDAAKKRIAQLNKPPFKRSSYKTPKGKIKIIDLKPRATYASL
jgi:hypothetical protein